MAKLSEIGNIPESWHIAKLGDLASVTSGGTPNRGKPEYWGGDIPWVKTGEVNYNRISTTEERITERGLKNSAARMIPTGTLLMAMYGQGATRGRVAILGLDAAINQACAAIFTSQDISVKFLFHFLSYDYARIRSLGHGANQRNMNSEIVRSIKVPVPTVEEQHTIASVIDAFDIRMQALEHERALLNELFHALLEELMSGRLSVESLKQITSS